MCLSSCEPEYAYLPKKRVAFEISESFAQARLKAGKEAFRSASAPTSWVLGSPGDDHGIFTFRKGYTGECHTWYIKTGPYLITPTTEEEW